MQTECWPPEGYKQRNCRSSSPKRSAPGHIVDIKDCAQMETYLADAIRKTFLQSSGIAARDSGNDTGDLAGQAETRVQAAVGRKEVVVDDGPVLLLH